MRSSHTSAHLQKKSTCFSSWTSPHSHLSQMLEPCHLQDSTLKWCARNLNLLKFLNICLSKSLLVQVGGDRKRRTSRTTLRTPTPLVIRHCFLVNCARTWKISFPPYFQMSETQIANELLHGNLCGSQHFLFEHCTTLQSIGRIRDLSRPSRTIKRGMFSDVFLQRGSTGEMSKYVIFMHSEAGHPLPFNPIGTIFASNWSWYNKLHEDVLGFMWVTLCANWQDFKLKMVTKTPIGWHGKTACVGLSPTTSSFHSNFLQWYLFVIRIPNHQKSCDLEWWVACCEEFVVKSGVHTTGN
jgi:hypothetical protein